MAKKTKIREKPKRAEKKANPFELKFTKQKHNILGSERSVIAGKPAAKKKKSYEQRKKTLGVEAENMFKDNKIVDKRLGQRDSTLSQDERASKRFIVQRSLAKGSKFNLSNDNDENEVLTHGGELLSSIQKFERLVDSDDDGGDGLLSSEVVARAHFGGGLTEDGDSEPTARPERKSRADFIKELIAKSKIEKNARQTEKDSFLETIDKLDLNFRNLLPKLAPKKHSRNAKNAQDIYDRTMKELMLGCEARATASNSHVGALEPTREEARRIKEELETRNRLMLAENNKEINSKSTVVKETPKKSTKRASVSFNKEVTVKNISPSNKKDFDGESTDDAEDENYSNEEDIDSDDIDEELSDEDDGFAELFAEDDGEDFDDDDDLEIVPDSSEDEDEESTTIRNRSVLMTPCPDDITIPIVVDMPSTYAELIELAREYPLKVITRIFERIAKCNHPSLKEGNKQRLNNLFVYVLRFFDDLVSFKFSSEESIVDVVGELQTFIYHLAKIDVERSVVGFRSFVKQVFRKICKRDSIPSFRVLALCRLIRAIFPTGENFHPVATLAYYMLTTALHSGQVTEAGDVRRYVLIGFELLEYIKDTKRYVPELLTFASAALFQALPANKLQGELPVNNIFGEQTELLLLKKKVKTLPPQSLHDIFRSSKCSETHDEDSAAAISGILALVQKMSTLWAVENSHAYAALFSPFVTCLDALPLGKFPANVHSEAQALRVHIKAEITRYSARSHLSIKQTEKTMLKMLEPRFDTDFNPERTHAAREGKYAGQRGETQKLQYQLKQERKGALKELRKDANFMAKLNRDKQLTADAERRRKVKAIIGGLQGQASEHAKEKNAARMHNKKMKRNARKKH